MGRLRIVEAQLPLTISISPTSSLSVCMIGGTMEWTRCTGQGTVWDIDLAALHHAVIVDRCLLWNAAFIHNELHNSGYSWNHSRWISSLDELVRPARWYSTISIVRRGPVHDCRYMPHSLISTRAFILTAFVSASRRQVRLAVKQTYLSWIARAADLVFKDMETVVRIPLPSGEFLELCANGTIRNVDSILRLMNARMRQDVQEYIAFR